MLQNTVPPEGAGSDQPAALAIGASDDFFRRRRRGVCRIHGGKFAGTVQAYVHKDDYDDYSLLMPSLFGENCAPPLKVGMRGVTALC
jgi:galactokinase